MRAATRSLPLLLLLAAAPAAQAVQLELGWDTRTLWDSNPLRTETDEESDFSIYAGPTASVRDRGRSLDYFLTYRLRYEQYVDLSSVNGFEHFLNGEVNWRMTPRSELRLTQHASRSRGLGIDFSEVDPADVIAEGKIERSPTVRSTTGATFSHRLTPLWTVQTTGDLVLYEYEDEERSDVASLRGSAQLTRPIGPRTVTGFGGAATRQEFDDSERTGQSGATIYEAFGIVQYRVEPTLTLSLSGGPAWNDTDQADVPEEQPFGPVFLPVEGIEQSEGSLTAFGRAALTKAWPTFVTEVSYQRRASASSGLGSTNLDLVNVELSWLPDRRVWRFDLRGTWTLQQSASDQFEGFELRCEPAGLPVCVTPVAYVASYSDSAIDQESYRIDLRATRRFGAHLVATAGAGWWRQNSSGSDREDRTVDNLRFLVGFTWNLAPIEF